MTTRASSTSTEFYRVTVTPSPDVDLTTLPVRMAFPASGHAPETWYAAQWEDTNVARVLIGPDGDVVLSAGAYDVYLEIEDGDEKPRFLADRLIVFTTVDTFASVAQLADTMNADIDPEDPRANQALIAATAAVRAYTRQYLSLVEDDAVTLAIHGDQLVLPERPVSEVTIVTLTDADTLDTDAYFVDEYSVLNFPQNWWWNQRLDVTYSHGYATLPDEVVTATLQVASRIYQSATNVGGGVLTHQAETIGGYHHEETYDSSNTTSVDAASGLSDTEIGLLNRFRQVLVG